MVIFRLFLRSFLVGIILSSLTMITAQQSFQSKRLDALLQRHGWIKIGLKESASTAQINMQRGGTIIADGETANCSAGIFNLRSSGGKITAVVPGNQVITGSDIILIPSDGYFQYNSRTYRGKARFVMHGSMVVINEVMIDDWLKGVLPAEIGSDSPLEALKAQAVAGRSEAIFRLSHPPHAKEGYDFCAGPHCQAYKGISEETENIRKACEQTLGFVLLANDDIVNGVYHNVCGGVTAAAEDVWDGDPEPGLKPVFDTLAGGTPQLASESAAASFIEGDGSKCFCYPGNPGYASYAKKYFRWTKTIDASKVGSLAGVGTLTDIRVTQRQPSGRVRKLTITGTNGSKTIDKELPIRNMFDLWSGLFVLKVEENGGRISSVTFVGAGNGHGVGMCQHGAREIARRGGTFDQILGHYYPGVVLQRIYRP